MDISNLAAQAVELISTYLSSVASGVATRVRDSAVERLYSFLATRMRQFKIGTAAIDSLEEQPGDPSTQRMAITAVSEVAAQDHEFATQLEKAVRDVTISQGQLDQAIMNSQVNIHTTGSLSMQRSVIASGNVDQSRRTFKLGLGGLLATAVVLLIGGGAIGYVIGEGQSPSPGPSAPSVAEGNPKDNGDDAKQETMSQQVDLLSTGSNGRQIEGHAKITVTLSGPFDSIPECQLTAPSGHAIARINLTMHNLNSEGVYSDKYSPITTSLERIVPTGGGTKVYDISDNNNDGRCNLSGDAKYGLDIRPFQEQVFEFAVLGPASEVGTSRFGVEIEFFLGLTASEHQDVTRVVRATF